MYLHCLPYVGSADDINSKRSLGMCDSRSDKLGHPIISYMTTCRVIDGAEGSTVRTRLGMSENVSAIRTLRERCTAASSTNRVRADDAATETNYSTVIRRTYSGVGFSETKNLRSYDAYSLYGEYTFTKRIQANSKSHFHCLSGTRSANVSSQT